MAGSYWKAGIKQFLLAYVMLIVQMIIFFISAGHLDKIEKALSDLEKAVEMDQRFKELAKKDKDFDKVRDMPRFKKLIT